MLGSHTRWLFGSAAWLLMSSQALAQVSSPPTTPSDSGASTAPSDNIAAAQGTALAPGKQPDDGGINDIVVTAQRRSQNLLSVPLSISATTGEQLVNTGIKQISQLQFTTPGFIPFYGTGYTQVYIRGIGNNIYVGADPAVATFIDDVPRIYGSMVNNFVDVERVEVLKGAQGGLYGRNATGGVINVITRQPSDQLDAQARLSYGEKNTFEGAGYINLPLSDRVAISFSAQRDTHSPYIKNLMRDATPYQAAFFPNGSYLGTPQQTADFLNKNIDPRKGYGRQNFWAVDSKLRVELADNFKITLAGDYSDKDDDIGGQLYNATPGVLQATIAGLLQQFGIDAVLPPDLVKSPTKKFTTYKPYPHVIGLKDYGGSATAVLSLPGVDLTSITAYRAGKSTYHGDIAAGALPEITANVLIDRHYVYQELRAVSTSAGPFHFLGGGTYLKTKFDGDTTIDILPPLATLTPTLSIDRVRNWSIYGQIGYDFTKALSLTISGRYINERNTAVFSSPAVSAASLVAKKFLPSATLSYQLENGGNIYARYAKGFKAGGVNPTSPPSVFPTDFGKLFGPEQVDTYEVGARAALFDRRVQVTSAVFYNDYRGLQTTTSGNATHQEIVEAIINAGSARTYGAEGSVSWRVIPPLTLGFNAGYLHAKYKQFANNDGSILNTFNFDGRQMIVAPRWQLGLTANLDQPLGDRYHLVGNVLASYIGRTIFSLGATGLPDAVQPAYWLVNTRIGIQTSDGRYSVAIFANNLFNKAYTTYGNTVSSGTSFLWGDPRIVGAEIRFKFRGM